MVAVRAATEGRSGEHLRFQDVDVIFLHELCTGYTQGGY
jgi:hypothetical protein